jgi:peptidoglycan/xylan/chitin deacetylase (PgdA/CDA1 family)
MFQNILTRIRKITQQKAAILMYHQVCERSNDPWELAVHPNHFHAQLGYLKNHFNVVPIAELAEGVVGHKMKKTIAITFDDGFKDNYTNAAPLLDWHDVPATFYVATTAMQHQQVYWWDALQDIMYQTEILPVHFEMVINEAPVKFTFASDRVLNNRIVNQIKSWNYNLPIPNERIALYMLLWHNIKPLGYAQQNSVLKDIREWAATKPVSSDQNMTMSVREMQMLSQNPLFSIGAHSVHHAMLSQQTPRDQAFEVQESKGQIEKWLGKPVNGFAYPYGNYNETTQLILKDAGFKYAVSTESKPVTADDDPFALPRIQVKNWCVYEFASKLNELINE